MAYEEYDYYNEPSTGSLKESLYEILRGLKDPKKLREAGISLKEALQLTPNVTESLGRGGVAQAIGTSGDLRELQDLTHSPFSKGFRNFTRAAQFLANPYATAIQQTAPTTEQTLDFVPRVTDPYEGYKQHETIGEFVAPASAYLGGKAAKAYANYVGPTVYKAVEDYMVKTGGILNAVEPGEAKKIQEVASVIDELGFYSPLENAILKIQQSKGTGDQFLKQLEKTPGVKTEELDVTGVKQYLLDHPTVTKQELLDYMGSSRLKLENKILDESMSGADTYDEYSLRGGDVYHDQDYIDSLAEDLHSDLTNDPEIYHQEQQALVERFPELYEGHELDPNVSARLNDHVDEALRERAQQQAHDMYYDNPITHHYDDYGYDIYGNPDNGYSIKDPTGRFLDLGNRNGIYDIDEAQDALRQHLLDEGVIDIGSEGGPKYEDYTLPGNYTNYREVLTTLPQKEPAFFSQITFKNDSAVDDFLTDMSADGFENMDYGRLNDSNIVEFKGSIPSNIEELIRRNGGNITVGREKAGQTYQSGHFDEPNVLAHTRLDDRMINGKKTLMVEEIQSDWHQAGRRKGYQTKIDTTNLIRELTPADKQRVGVEEGFLALGKDNTWGYYPTRKEAEEHLQKVLKDPNALPDAPFKKNWHELMMKQILNEAVKGDYDAVAFTTGKQQAERYNLSKQIDSLDLIPAEEGVKQFVLSAYKDGRRIINKEVNEDELPDLIGKEAAKKLLEQETTKLHRPEGVAHGNPNVFKGRELVGLELDVGGEGMKGFYDKILPDFINKYGKKYGIGVKKANLPSEQMPSQEAVNDYFKSINMSRQDFEKLSLDERGKILGNAAPKGDEVHYFDLSDMAKKEIKSKGQPLFSGLGLAPAPLLMDNEEDN
jgi:hypothetical protein